MPNRSLTSRVAAALALLAAAAGCAVGPDYQPPRLALTPGFRSAPADPPAAGAPPEDARWWSAFKDPDLTRVVNTAGSQNLDLAAARARLEQSRAAARAAGAALLPTGSAQGSGADDRQSLNGPLGSIGRRLPGFRRHVDDETLGIAALWELDLFGGARRREESARAEAKASAADLAAARLAVQAEAADAYVQIRAAQARLRIARSQLAVETDLVGLLQRRVREGVSPERDLQTAEAALEDVQAFVPTLIVAQDTAFNRLDVLMGLQPGVGRRLIADVRDLPQAPTPGAGATPRDLLRRRPDLIAAEQRLRAANAGVGAAIAGYYPSVSLGALAGFDSLSASSVFKGASQESLLDAGLRWRLFDFGRIDAEVAAARGRRAEALAAYRQSVLRAAEEVENGFTRLREARARAAALGREITALTTARRQASEAYDSGVTSLIELRDDDRNLLNASDQLAQAKAAAAQAAVAACRALGGSGPSDLGS